MAFMDYVKQGWEAAQLKKDPIQQLADNQEAIGPAIGILAIGGACAGIGSLSFGRMVVFAVMSVVGGFVSVAIVHFVATTFFDGKGQLTRLAMPVFCASAITWATIIPVVGPAVIWPVAGLWLLVVMTVTLEAVYGMERGKAIGAVAVPLFAFLVIGTFFAIVAGISIMALTGRLCI